MEPHARPEEVGVFSSEEGAVRSVFLFGAQFWLLFVEMYDEISRRPVRTLIGFVLVVYACTAGNALFDKQFVGFLVADDAVAGAVFALVFDGAALATAGIALHLHLLEDARC